MLRKHIHNIRIYIHHITVLYEPHVKNICPTRHQLLYALNPYLDDITINIL